MIHKKRNRRVSLPDEYVSLLEKEGEIRIDGMGRIRGFDLYIRRQLKRGKLF